MRNRRWQMTRSGYLASVQRRQPFRFRDVIHGVGIEERIERLHRPCHRGEAVARGPAIDFPDVLDHKGVTELFVDLNFDEQVGNPDADAAVSLRRAHEALEAFAPET